MVDVVENEEIGTVRLLGSSRHGNRPMPGCMPDCSEGQSAFWPVHAGPHAGPLGAPAGMPAGPCRAGCRAPRGFWRHASRPVPASTPGGSGPQPAWLPAHAGLGAGPALLASSCVRSASLLASSCRPGRHGSQPMPAWVPAPSVFLATYLFNGYLVLEHINRPPPTSGQGSQAN